MKKSIVLVCFIFIQLVSAQSAKIKDTNILNKQFYALAKRFAYQEHFAWESKVLMCHELAILYKKLVDSPKIKESEEYKLALRAYDLGARYTTCGSQSLNYRSRKNEYQFKEWEDIEKLHKKLFKNINNHQPKLSTREYCQTAVKYKQWDYIFFFTDDNVDPKRCPEAVKLVEPHYSHDYKMRNWE
ncbi:MAG: hypothetical protein SFU25_10215 [Candidatus Caenarcaniphilales bacterium]|nr:hypothetical protein [Candidatus Caenarcaniphilales bacterium]